MSGNERVSEPKPVPGRRPVAADATGARIADNRQMDLQPVLRAAAQLGEHEPMLSQRFIFQLQRSFGNQFVQRLLTERAHAAPPIRMPVAVPAIQRSVYVGPGKTELTSVDRAIARKGRGDRNVQSMIDHVRKFFFKDQAEMLAYAAKQTDTIGYLESDSVWIRLPEDKLLVLGELHSNTTLTDVVKATGTTKYIYEPYEEFPEELLRRSKRLRKAVGEKYDESLAKAGEKSGKGASHQAEAALPKIVVALTGLREKVQRAVSPAPSAVPAKSQASGGDNSDGYDREAVELKLLRTALLFAAKSAKYAHDSPELWDTYQAEFNTTAKELERGVDLSETTFVRLIKAAKLSFEDFITSFKEAAYAELSKQRLVGAFKTFETQREDVQAAKAKDAPEYEKMREFYMYTKIMEAKGQGYRLAGIGEAHRLHLEDVLSNESGIIARPLKVRGYSRFKTFVEEQKEQHKLP